MKNYGYVEIAYDAYKAQTGGKSLITGDPLPEFEALRIEIRDAWWEAAEAVVRAQTAKFSSDVAR